MFKNFLLFAFTIFFAVSSLWSAPLFSQAIPISQARAMPLGSTVTLRGVVTNGNELGKIRYMQDGTAGIAAFPGTGSAPGFEAAVKTGDSIEVTGTLVNFHGLLEISPIAAWQIISSGHLLPQPKHIALSDMGDHLEGQLVSVACVMFSNAGGVFSDAGTYNIADMGGTSAKIYLRNGHPLQNTAIPGSPFFLTAIVSEYDDFQLLPRFADDLADSPCFYFPEKIAQSDIQTTGFTVSWKTNLLSSAKIRYGTSPALGNEINIPAPTLAHAYQLTGLQPGAIYWVQIAAAHNGETIFSEPVPFATRSLSSGQIKLYFNHPIDKSSANGLAPAGDSFQELLDETIARINAAQQTIDVAVYTNNRADITAALAAAHNRGVQVRYIAALDGNSPALEPAPPFPVVYGNASAIMHNKFMSIDANLVDHSWVMSGSTNWTTGNMSKDYNNTLFIQDQSLARTYELEFEEMWGSENAQPDTSKSRFGGAKKNNTPHRFVIGNIPVESYFSPSDQVTSRIAATIRTAEAEIVFAMFSFTKDEPSAALLDVFDNGAAVRGMIENINDPGAEFTYLRSEGINVKHHAAAGDLHHKYCVVDAQASAPTVVTGSHNWSAAAETANDENTLIIHDEAIATLFQAEFEKRWFENAVSTKTPIYQQVAAFPNPVAGVLNLSLEPSANSVVWVRNILGQTVLHTTNTSQINVEGLPPGFYAAVIETRHGIATVSFQKI